MCSSDLKPYIDQSGTLVSLDEYIQDITGGQITAGTGISVSYNDTAGTTTISVNTSTTVDTSTAQTLTNKTINLSSNTLVATSAQLAAALTDETGTGLVVFGTSPTISTSLITDSATFTLFNTVATTVTEFGAATSQIGRAHV